MPRDPQKPFPKRARLNDESAYVGMRGYFITINTYKRKPFFSKQNIASSAIKYLYETASKKQFDVIVYCFMPNHAHLVLTGKTEKSNLVKFIKAYKQKSSYYFKQATHQKLWATSYHDYVLRSENDIKTVGRYTLRNPVKAGFVKDVLDYTFSGSFIYSMEELVQSDPWLQVKEEQDVLERMEDVVYLNCFSDSQT